MSGWTGAWVTERLGVRLADADRPFGVGLADLVGLAVRRNPRRAHLLVSTVLGKHVPTDPRLVYGAGLLLGRRIAGLPAATETTVGDALRHALSPAHPTPSGAASGGDDTARTDAAARLRDALTGAPGAEVPALVIGYAETATALGHAVADALGDAVYLHSTRRPVDGVAPYGGFEEEHSHATSHLLLPADRTLVERDGPVVLVDDELSTGNTVLNTIRALHAVRPRDHYVVAALVDVRGPRDRARMAAFADGLGARIDAVALASGRVELPPDILARGQALVAGMTAAPEHAAGDFPVVRVDPGWPEGLPEGGRHGFTPDHRERLDKELPAMAARLADALPGGARRVLVLGFEELMYAPLRLAEALADQLPGADVRYSTTTRSPVLAVDDPGYAIRTRIAFPAHDDPADGPGERYAYNVAGGGFDAIVLIVDAAGDTPGLASGLLTRLRGIAPVVLATLPAWGPALGPQKEQAGRPRRSSAERGSSGRSADGTGPAMPKPLYGPDFGSYPAEDVAWLLKDLSHAKLEAPTEEREAAIQAGRAHYAESLPVEYQPGPEYQRLFHQALEVSASRLAYAVGLITELILAERGRGAVLVSLARAGTPVGVLVRRWARAIHGLDLPHYTMSIVRGRGIDRVALRYLTEHHDPASVMFVDGWTGKGAITKELTAALEEHFRDTGVRFPGDLAVLADPGRCTHLYGTREDFLIPSACLNSTVSGLVSRTVLNDALIGPGDFHGAKFYAELASSDVSAVFLDAVCARFGEVAGRVARDWPALRDADRTPDWSGWAAVRRIGERHGIDDLNLIKPGVGETTRVLLRRVPWKVLARSDALASGDLAHIRLLAAERGVPVVEVEPDAFPYACAGLIHPRFGQGAAQ
ncbi:phosphoribosyltransferase [Thermomonospora cellulosilytica]|uniref:Adenine/guanine phosphoribosyltransferase-like PRPP-binding protein n=1 Tax=Thermomonospora cellulosilytica TaxID=1411118 RepID=A0A7W3N3N6_9ACTN|nr:phosphoribosyltransferase [Thermomonospora cellulosilytica]MBA9006847.1 adenine/guanine phosphoribosyltransferase-like PRPP-binding protein [Thermomonospora cellulosilytica]